MGGEQRHEFVDGPRHVPSRANRPPDASLKCRIGYGADMHSASRVLHAQTRRERQTDTPFDEPDECLLTSHL